MNLNKVFVCGRVTADIVLKSTPGGQQVTNFSIATNRVWNDKNGAKHEDAEFHNIVAWGRTAEVVSQFSGKGSELLVEGRLQTRKWEAKDGSSRQTTEILAEHIQLGAKPRQAAPAAAPADTRPPLGRKAPPASSAAQEEVPTINIDENEEIKPEDLPF